MGMPKTNWIPKKTFEELANDPVRLLGATASLGATELPTVFGKKDYVTQAADKLNIGKTMGPPGGATPLLQQQANPYAAAAGTMTPMQQQLAQQLAGMYGTGAGAMTGLIGQLQGQTQGDFGAAGSLGQQLLQQGLSKNLGDVRTQLASQRGLSPALAASIAATKQAELGGQTTQQAGILGLQQQMEAQKQLGGLASGAATMGAEGAAKIGGQLTQADLESKRIQAGIAQANQAAQAADKARTVQAVTGVLGAGAQVGAAAAGAAHGGRIDGVAPYSGDTLKNDVVPANLSPGEIVIPRSAAGSKKDAKSFIEALTDWDEEPSYSKVLQARQKKNYSDGGQVPFPMSGPYAPVTQEKLDAATDKPLPAAQRLKTNIDDFLTGNVVEPLAQRGYPNLGAALATVPSVAAEMMIPSTTGELQAGVIPFPGAKLTKAAKDALTAEGKGAKNIAKEIIATKSKSTEFKPNLKLASEEIDELPQVHWSESAIKDASEPYSGNIQNNIWQKDFVAGVEQKPQLVGDLKGTLGKDVPKGGTDPFAWIDTKYGATKKALEQNFDKPLTINTRSDLIAHDDYINLLNPKKHKINIHILSPEDERITKILEPGAASTKRRLAAAQKLQGLGFNVTLIQDILKNPRLSETLKSKISSFSDLGDFDQKVNNVYLDDAAVERLKKVLGDLVK